MILIYGGLMIKDLPTSNQQETIVGENVLVTGKLQTSSNILINGKVKGEISSEGSVIIGKTATIDGPVSATDVKVEGVVNGNITASNMLELESEAKVFGDIKTKTLSIQPGAIFVGKSSMLEETPSALPKEKHVEKEEKKEPEPEIELE